MVSENFDPWFKPKWELRYKLGDLKVLWGYIKNNKIDRRGGYPIAVFLKTTRYSMPGDLILSSATYPLLAKKSVSKPIELELWVLHKAGPEKEVPHV